MKILWTTTMIAACAGALLQNTTVATLAAFADQTDVSAAYGHFTIGRDSTIVGNRPARIF